MKTFEEFKKAQQQQFNEMAQHELYFTDTDKDIIWELYLNSFPEGTNPLYKERTVHDCQCCKQYIRACGNVVAIINNKLVSIWDIEGDGPYKEVADVLSAYVKSQPIKNIFRYYQTNLGTDFNHQLLENELVKTWSHFYFKLPNKFVIHKEDIGSFCSDKLANHDVLKRGFKEISLEAAETVIELIDQNSIYRGEEFKPTVELFIQMKKEELKVPEEKKECYYWNMAVKAGGISRIRNTAIGTLLCDISDGVELDHAVHSFGSKMDGYKRPTSIATKSMIENARKTMIELGYENAVYRRHAIPSDLTINNVLFADRSVKKDLDCFDNLITKISVNKKSLEKVQEVFIETFIDDILPKAESIELLLENRLRNNLMSVIAPKEKDSKNMLKWDNNFTWAYNNDVADSMRERVKDAGGKVDGVLRFSIQWNEKGNDNIDFDAHCIEPSGNEIYFSRRMNHKTLGNLDIDIMQPGTKTAVENITWPKKEKILEGKYLFFVHNYSSRISNSGFSAEIEYNNEIFSFTYDKVLKGREKVLVAEITLDKANGITFLHQLPENISSKEIWGLSTETYQKVSIIMDSPNYWDENKSGNKHHFFILEGCKNNEPARGFFNEHLNEKLTKHRKVFEMLGANMKVEPSENQLSGVGFSSTQQNYVYCKVSGNFNRTIKIIF